MNGWTYLRNLPNDPASSEYRDALLLKEISVLFFPRRRAKEDFALRLLLLMRETSLLSPPRM